MNSLHPFFIVATVIIIISLHALSLSFRNQKVSFLFRFVFLKKIYSFFYARFRSFKKFAFFSLFGFLRLCCCFISFPFYFYISDSLDSGMECVVLISISSPQICSVEPQLLPFNCSFSCISLYRFEAQ
uniref:Uncharacterized protein n=1 Tax=Trypanosoma congolense (strain IL3000) TaxID=1068625 RepID=G0UN59_TRYCI|nr:hypothetical protein, unlikely [Trypanosoma congolense IL3000]